nr:zinc finger, CCHC-type [Tanacetum cinerariifolium]
SYAMTSTRSDIAYAVGRLSRFSSNPSRHHWHAITRVLKYLKGTMNYGLSYVGYPLVLEGYSYASWINHVEDSSSTSGWLFLLGGGAISWASKKQTCITSSTMKSEFIEGTTRSTYLVNRSPSSAIGFKNPIDMLGFFGWLASIKKGMLEPVKVKCIFLGYHESIVGTGSMHELHGFEFEVESLRDHTFEVQPQENVDQGAGLQEVQTQDLMDYLLARDKEQHLACELFKYREDSIEAAFVVAVVNKIYVHESLTFNDTVACEVISKWKAGLKENIAVRSDVFVLNNGCRKSSDDSHDYYCEYAPGLLVKAKGNVLVETDTQETDKNQ